MQIDLSNENQPYQLVNSSTGQLCIQQVFPYTTTVLNIVFILVPSGDCDQIYDKELRIGQTPNKIV